MAVTQSVSYSNERKQFGSLISAFGSIKYKLAEQVIKIFTTESAVYRTSKNIDEAVEQNLSDCTKEKAMVTAYAQFAVEAAILKVFGSEALDYIVDEAVQIYGGMGYSAEMPVDRGYRDSRINRIFEGTNEINRILVVDTLLKRGAKKEFNLFEEAETAFKNLKDLANRRTNTSDYYTRKSFYIKNFKLVALVLIHLITEKYKRKLMFEQEILNDVADILMNLYVAESTLLRVQKMEGLKGEDQMVEYRDILDVFVFDTASLIRKSALDVIYSIEDNTNTNDFVEALQNLSTVDGLSTKDARRRIANKLIEDNEYNF